MSATSITASLAIAITLATVTPAIPPALEPAFGNTIVTTYPNGKITRTWLHRDGTYEGLRANGDRTGGTWLVKTGKLCLTQKKPFLVPMAFCTEIVPGRIGVSWMAKGLRGEPVRNTLVAGL